MSSERPPAAPATSIAVRQRVRGRWLLMLAATALLWHALHPLAAPLLARAHADRHGGPASFADICTTLGLKRLPLAGGTADIAAPATTPGAPASHAADGDHCPWCRLVGPDLIAATTAPAFVPAPTSAALGPAVPVAFFPSPVHRPDHARGPPATLLNRLS